MKHAPPPTHLHPVHQYPQRKCECGQWIWLSHYPQHREYRCPATARERAPDVRGVVGPNVGIEPPYSVGSNDGLGVCPIDATDRSEP